MTELTQNTTATQAGTATGLTVWTVDKAHSTVEFAVKHMMVSTVKGTFREFEGTAHIDEEHPERSSVRATVDVASIDTKEPQRDAHLKSDDFFNAERFPKMTFVSKRVERVDEDTYNVIGDLTIRDITREVVLKTTFEGRVTDPWGNDRAGFEATAEISRKEFGLRWNQLLETGGAVVGDKVRIILHIELVKTQ
jgi:polyisoprenoid-binding protein YceI